MIGQDLFEDLDLLLVEVVGVEGQGIGGQIAFQEWVPDAVDTPDFGELFQDMSLFSG